MKRILVFFLIGLVLGLTGCGNKEKEAEQPEAVAVEDENAVVIKFWHMADSGIRKEVMDKIISDFNSEHEGEIRVEDLGLSFWDYWDKISVSMAAMEEPDVFLHDLGNVGMRAETGVLQNLDSLLAENGMNPDELFFSAPLNMCKFEGSFYALPYETDVRLLFYNKDMFESAGLDPEKAPSSWDELLEIADKLTVKFDNGDYDRLGFNLISPQSYFLTYVWGTGAGYLDEEGEIKVNKPEIVDALTEWKSMVDKYGKDGLYKFASEFGGGAADPFIVEKLGMTIGVPDLFTQIKTYNPDMNFGFCQVPYPAGPASWSNGFSLEMSSRSEHPEEAFAFVSYLMSRDVQFYIGKNSSALITNMEAALDPALLEDPFWKVTVDTLDNTHFRPFSIQSPVWYDHMNLNVDEVVYGRMTPQEALDHAQELIGNDYKKYELTH